MCLAISAFILVLLARSLSSGAQPSLTWTHEALWKPAKAARPCEVERRRPRNIRCLFDSAEFPTSTIEVINTSSDAVSFTYDEWHSFCGTGGGKVVSEAFTLAKDQSLVLDVLNAGRGITCREGFIVDCKMKITKACSDVLSVKAREWKGNLQP